MKNDKTTFTKFGLLRYQADFAANTSRFKIGLWARQTGKDHTAAAEAVLDCFLNPGAVWIIVAASERQALESLSKAKEFAAGLKFRIDQYSEAPGNTPYSVARTASTEIKWSNGSRLIALPANPSTIRGYSANLILTEFAFHENPDAIWRAIYPAISNPLRGGVKKLRIISTPNGLNNKFAQLWHSNAELHSQPQSGSSLIRTDCVSPNRQTSAAPFPRPLGGEGGLAKRPIVHQFCSGEGVPVSTETHIEGNSSTILSPSVLSVPRSSVPSVLLSSRSRFHTSKITIHDAIAAGLPLDPNELQTGLNDPEAWSQEYLCEFMDNSTVLLPYDLIETCESSLATELSTPESLTTSAIPGRGRPELYAGLDFARKNHLTVLWILERLPASALNLNPNLSSPIHNSKFIIHNSPSPSVSSVHPSSVPSVSLPSSIFLTREILCLRNTSTPDQLAQLRPRLNLCRKVSLDYTGPGIGLGDFLHRELGSRVELCPFTSSFKAELFPRLAAAFESRQLLIPIGRDIREDLHSIYRTTTNSGNILYRAHATPDGHADRTTALALALRAAQTAPALGGVSTVGRKYRFIGNRSNQRTLAIIY
jgi:phage FluMu gp28-like protein